MILRRKIPDVAVKDVVGISSVKVIQSRFVD